MAEASKIEWTDSTFNPWIGCTKISPGCDRCYAERLVTRYRWTLWGPHGDRKRTSAANWRKPIQWNSQATVFQAEHSHRQRVFCASLADVFDNKADPTTRADLFELIKATPNLDWLLLTKRPQLMARFLPKDWGNGYPNVWLGSTMEDQERYDQRWPLLRDTPAAIRFISYEPAIGPIVLDAGGTQPDWIISGGESGPGSRLMQPAWARAVRDQCQSRGIAFMHKQWGNYPSNPIVAEDGKSAKDAKLSDHDGKGGAILDGRLWREFPRH